MKYLIFVLIISNLNFVNADSVVEEKRAWGKDKGVLRLCFAPEGSDQAISQQDRFLDLVHKMHGNKLKNEEQQTFRENYLKTLNKSEREYLKSQLLVEAVNKAYNANDIGIKLHFESSCPIPSRRDLKRNTVEQAFEKVLKEEKIDAIVFLGMGEKDDGSFSSIGHLNMAGKEEGTPALYLHLPITMGTVRFLRNNLRTYTSEKNKNIFKDNFGLLDKKIFEEKLLQKKVVHLFEKDPALSFETYFAIKIANDYYFKNEEKEKDTLFMDAFVSHLKNELGKTRTEEEHLKLLYSSNFSIGSYVKSLTRLSQMIFLHELGHLLGLRHNFMYKDLPKGDQFIRFDPHNTMYWDQRHAVENHQDSHESGFAPAYYTSYDPFSIMSYGLIFSYRYIPESLTITDLSVFFKETTKNFEIKMDSNIVKKIKEKNSYHFKVNISQGDTHTLRCLYKKEYERQKDCRSTFHPLKIVEKSN